MESLIGRRDAALEGFTENCKLPEILATDTRYTEIEALLGEDLSTWSVSPDLARLLARTIIGLGLSNVLEFGAGSAGRCFAVSRRYGDTSCYSGTQSLEGAGVPSCAGAQTGGSVRTC